MSSRIRFGIPCSVCEVALHVRDTIYLDAQGPFCPDCFYEARRAKFAKPKKSVRSILPVRRMGLLEILGAALILSMIIYISIPIIFGGGGQPKVLDELGLRELQKLFQANRSTEIGLVAQQIINYGSLSGDTSDQNRLNPLLTAKQLESLLRPESQTPLTEGAVISDRLGDNEAGMRSALREAAELAGVPPDQYGLFAIAVTRSWAPGDYENDVGSLIEMMQGWKSINSKQEATPARSGPS